MIKDPVVSVYIVNHNYGRFLNKRLIVFLKQTFKDFEIIFIDNGSEDDSKEKLEKYYFSNKKIKIILQKNIGLNAANNIALKFARGKYIMRLDADDYLDKNALEIMYLTFGEKNLGLVFPDYFTVDENNNILNLIRRHDFTEVTLLDQPAHGACTMIRRDYLQTIGGYDESYHCQDGWDLWVKLIKLWCN